MLRPPESLFCFSRSDFPNIPLDPTIELDVSADLAR